MRSDGYYPNSRGPKIHAANTGYTARYEPGTGAVSKAKFGVNSLLTLYKTSGFLSDYQVDSLKLSCAGLQFWTTMRQ
jgi:hypothetical protein